MYNIPTVSMTEFGRRLMKLRQDRGLNRSELARQSGVSRVSIIGYETGSEAGKYPSLPRLIALAQALHCTLEELTGIEDFQKLDKSPKLTEQAIEFVKGFERLSEQEQKALEMTMRAMLAKSESHDKPEEEPEE